MLVAALGFTVVGAGVALLVLPGPGVIVIIVGLAILATEFAWAERALDKTIGRRRRRPARSRATSPGGCCSR